LALASYHGLIDIVTVILRGEGSSYRADLNATTAFGFTPLMCAIAQSHLDIAELLCTFGADVNFRETHGIGITALMLAAHCGNLHACTFLLESNAEVNAQCKLNGWTPLMFATAIRSLDIINLLLDRGSDPGIVNNSEE
ncbi:ankyrin, partial [Gonapodya prolifera JEL478]